MPPLIAFFPSNTACLLKYKESVIEKEKRVIVAYLGLLDCKFSSRYRTNCNLLCIFVYIKFPIFHYLTRRISSCGKSRQKYILKTVREFICSRACFYVHRRSVGIIYYFLAVITEKEKERLYGIVDSSEKKKCERITSSCCLFLTLLLQTYVSIGLTKTAHMYKRLSQRVTSEKKRKVND